MRILDLDSLKMRDLHVHTAFCQHAEGEMEDYVKAALDIGLTEIGFLEHVEAGVSDSRRIWLTDDEIEAYWRSGQELKEKYQGRIAVTVGLELGVNPHAVEELKQIARLHPWDRIGLSCHFIPYQDGLLNICSRKSIEILKNADHKALNRAYYRQLREHIPIFKPDFVCHLDIPRKLMKDCGRDFNIRILISRVLYAMAAHGAALEINNSGYGWVRAPFPSPDIIREAWDLGIGLVLNSDSHHPNEVGRHFHQAVEYIAEAVKELRPGFLEAFGR